MFIIINVLFVVLNQNGIQRHQFISFTIKREPINKSLAVVIWIDATSMITDSLTTINRYKFVPTLTHSSFINSFQMRFLLKKPLVYGSRLQLKLTTLKIH